MGPLERDEDSQLTLRFGHSTETWALLLSYGWLLREWRAGRLGLHLDANINVLGGLEALTGEASELGGATANLRMRPFSGEHFGGLSFHAGLGAELGRFRLRRPSATDPTDIRWSAAAVLEVGGRVEWWVKNDEAVDSEGEVGRVKPRNLDFSYRLIQPATPRAQRIHEVLASYTLYF